MERNPIYVDNSAATVIEVEFKLPVQRMMPVEWVEPKRVEIPISATAPTLLKGKSAYEIAIEHGFVGSEEQWLQSLKGENAKQVRVILSPFAELYRAGQRYRASAVVCVMDGVEDITGSLHKSCFAWQRISANTKGDPTWNLLHNGIGHKLELTEEDIIGDTQIYVYIKDNNNNEIQTIRII